MQSGPIASGPNNNITIVGAGPIGLAYAWGLKTLNPGLNVTVLEKYEEYQRKHTLIVDPDILAELMSATQTQHHPELSRLLARLKKDPHIRTNELQDIFARVAHDKGVNIRHEEIKEETIHEQLPRYKPNLIIGGDGTHSIISKCLFASDNIVKIDFDYVLQLRYEIKGEEKARDISKIDFIQSWARYGIVANEYVGAYDPKTQTTPITMQMMISRETFNKLKAATSKNPHWLYDDARNTNNTKIPPEILGFLNYYIGSKIIDPRNPADQIKHETVQVSVNEAPATYAKQPLGDYNNVPVLLVGDASLGLSYFKGLNAGLKAAAKFFSFTANTLRKHGLSRPQDFIQNVRDYCAWFLKEFAPAKVREVESYSTWQIRAPMKVMETARCSKGGSFEEDLEGDLDIIGDFLKLNNTMPSADESGHLYPHRAHDLIKFGQLEYIPVTYTIKKTGKLFVDFFKPYKSTAQFKQDLKQPLVGLVNVGTGFLKILAGVATANPKRLGDGFFRVVRGAIELVTTPLAWLVKPFTRGIATLIDKPKIENNAGMKRVAEAGLAFVDKDITKENVNLTIYKMLAYADDLHRKFNKATNRGQESAIAMDEEAAYCAVRTQMSDQLARAKLDSESALLVREQLGQQTALRNYFSLFAGRAKPTVIHEKLQLHPK